MAEFPRNDSARQRNREGRPPNLPKQGGLPVPVRRPRLPSEPVRNTVKVYAKDENFAKAMTWLLGARGRGFASDGSGEWPKDQFTQRRLRDGDITLEPPKKNNESQERETHHRRSRAIESSQPASNS